MENKVKNFKFRYKKIIGYATWALAAILIVSTVRNVNKVQSIRKQVAEERARVSKIEAENENLQAQISQAQSQEFIDKQMRDKLGLTKDGEAIVVLPAESVVKSFAPPKTVSENTLPSPNWEKWRRLFF